MLTNTNLIIFLIFLIIIVLVLIKTYQDNKRRKIKEKSEDIIKFLYKQDKEKKETNFHKVQLFSKLEYKKLSKILDELLREKKIKYDQDNIKLTIDGEKEAKNLIEKHRALEKILFDDTSIEIEEIHSVAEREEHKNIEYKESSYDCIDPHGDIITGEEIEYYSLNTIAQNTQNLNQIFKIVHIEDEPKEVYKEIVELDLAPSYYIKIKNITFKEIEILTDKGKIIKINHILGSNIHLVYLAEEECKYIKEHFSKIEKNIDKISTLDKLKISEEGKIIGLSFYIRGEERRRLLELGLTKNSKIKPIYNNMLGEDPRVYKIKNTMIALRKEQAKKIYVIKEN